MTNEECCRKDGQGHCHNHHGHHGGEGEHLHNHKNCLRTTETNGATKEDEIKILEGKAKELEKLLSEVKSRIEELKK
jgi:hypothetical protein